MSTQKKSRGAPKGNKNRARDEEMPKNPNLVMRIPIKLKTQLTAASIRCPTTKNLRQFVESALRNAIINQCPYCGKIDFDTPEHCKNPNVGGPGVGQWSCEYDEMDNN